MKNLAATIIIIIAVLFGAVLGYIYAKKTTTVSDQPRTGTNELLLTTEQLNDVNVYTSDRYLFRLRLPSTLAYSGKASAQGTVFGARFMAENTDTSERRNRNTPNGFNTSSYNIFGFLVYRNPNHVTVNDEGEFRRWLKNVGKNDTRKLERTTLNNIPIIRTEEADGIRSVGVYYYFFSPEFIYAFGTGDFPDEAMQEYLKGFSPLARL